MLFNRETRRLQSSFKAYDPGDRAFAVSVSGRQDLGVTRAASASATADQYGGARTLPAVDGEVAQHRSGERGFQPVLAVALRL